MATLGCSFGHCEDMDAAIDELIAAPYTISQAIWNGIRTSHPLLRMLESTKQPFPSGMGDVLNLEVLHINEPNAFEARNWTRLAQSGPDNNACCFQLNEIQYGSDRVSGCMYKYGLKTPPLCKVDLALRWQWETQLEQRFDTMRAYARGTWSHWLAYAYPKSVLNVVLNKDLGYPESIGYYPKGVTPTSILTYAHAQRIAQAVRHETGDPGAPIPGYTTLVMSDEDAYAFEENYALERVKFGYRTSDVSDVPSLNNELGTVKRIGQFMVVVNTSARKFNLPSGGQGWDEAQVEEVINVPAYRGTKPQHNPEYDKAPFSETLLISLDAVRWLTPPSAMTAANRVFPAVDYSGQFIPVRPSPDCDPFQQQVYFAALFVSGMIGVRPRLGRAILHLAARACAKDIVNVCNVNVSTLVENDHPIYAVTKLLTSGQLQIRYRGTLPSPCPAGYSLFLTTRKGHRYLVNNLVSTAAWAGDSEHPNGGTDAVISLVDTAAAITREGCDPWESIACLPSTSAVSDSCAGCSPIPADDLVTADCVRTWTFASDTAIQLIVGGSPVLSGGPFTTANALQTAIATYIGGGGNGGGTVSVTLTPDKVWTVAITGNSDPDLSTATISYQDGTGDTGGVNAGAPPVNYRCGAVDG